MEVGRSERWPGELVSGSVVVLGSANADLVLEVARIPAPGETVLCTSSQRTPGGKGANQAVAAARSGAATAFVGALGTDGEAELLRSALTDAGVDVSTVRTVDGPSGLAVVTVTPDGQNSIVVAAGANGSLGKLDEAQRKIVARAEVLLCQLEIPLATVLDGMRAARNAGVRTVLNAAPSHPLSPPTWDVLDLLVVNEHEAADLADREPDDVDGCLAVLLERVPEVVITLGADGSVYAARDAAPLWVAAPRVDVVDTTGAGDTFCGVLSASLAEGRPIAEALHRATAASSLSVQRAGAVASIPTADEIEGVGRGAAGPGRS